MAPQLDDRRSIAIGILLGAAIAAAVATLWWNRVPLLARWRLVELRSRPELLDEHLASTVPVRALAAELFLREPAGQEALFRLYLLEFERTTPRMGILEFLPRRREQGIVGGWLALWEGGHRVYTVGATHKGMGSSLRFRPEDPQRRRRILARLDAASDRVFTHPAFAGFEFVIRPIVDGKVAPPPWDLSGEEREEPERRRAPIGPELSHVCFFRVVGA